MDSCLGSISVNGEYNYMSASECITARIRNSADTEYIDVSGQYVNYGRICPDCQNNLENEIGKVGGNALDSDNKDNDVAPGSIIGLAKDGHVIYGPVQSGNDN